MESIEVAPDRASADATPSPIDWLAIWARTARHLARHAEVGLSGLLTEDVLRFAVVQELVAGGIRSSAIEVEWRRPGVRDAVDLVVTSPELVAVEFKYPREPRETNAAWTQHLGEALKDFYRVASMPAGFSQRWCVQLWSRRVNAYFDGVAVRNGLALATKPGQRTYLDPSIVRGLPATATGRLHRWMPDLPVVSAVCAASEWVSSDLLLIAHAVEQAAMVQPS